MLSIKSVNALSHYTDWTIAHVHAGALGWVGFMTFGMIYWLAARGSSRRNSVEPEAVRGPLLARDDRHPALRHPDLRRGHHAGAHVAGVRLGGLPAVYPEFVETTTRLIPMYWVRVLGGTLYLVGAVLCVVNAVDDLAGAGQSSTKSRFTRRRTAAGD